MDMANPDNPSPTNRGARRALIGVIPLGPVEPEVVRIVSDSIQGVMRVPVDQLESAPIPQDSFMSGRGQYNAMVLVKHLAENHAHNHLKVLGIISKDITNPILTHVFGEAYMDGPAAVMSYFRLHSGPGGRPASRELFLDRIVKVAIHEIAHTFAIPHCHTDRCVMRASNGLMDLDQKLNYMCDYCRTFLADSLARALEQEGLNEVGGDSGSAST